MPILAPFTSNEYTIKEYFSFVEEILAIRNANSFVMASFDIKSLFTNIPLEETIDIASQNYFNSIYQHRFFTRKFFEGLPSLSVKDILFLFKGTDPFFLPILVMIIIFFFLGEKVSSGIWKTCPKILGGYEYQSPPKWGLIYIYIYNCIY